MQLTISETREEIWDIMLNSTENNIESWRKEKTGVGPEPAMDRRGEGTAEATIYADDNSAGEEAETVPELKEKTEVMLMTIV